MIPINCPNCDKYGEVPPDRLDSKLKCKGCGVAFYIDATGDVELVDEKAARRRQRKQRQQASEPIEIDFGKLIKGIPKPVRYGLPAVAAAAILLVYAARLIGSLGVPTDLASRATYVGELYAAEDLQGLLELTTSATTRELEDWYEDLRPRLNPDAEADQIVVAAEEMGDGRTLVSLTAIGAPPPPPPSGNRPPASNSQVLELYWTESDGSYFINGRKTFDEYREKLKREARRNADRR